MADINSSLPVTDTTDGTTGTAVPTQAQQVGGTDGTNLRALSVDTTGKLNVNNVSGTISLPTGAATETTLAKLPLAQGSTTSGQSGPLTQGAVTTASPSYSTAQTSPLSLTLAGALRTDASSTTQPVSGTVTANQGGTWNINNISGTISLPTGAATSANQTNASQKTQIVDGSGNVIASTNNQLQVRDIINTGSQYAALSVTTSATLAKAAGSALTNRKFISITPTNGTVYYGTSNAVTTTTGTPIFKNAPMVLAFSENITVYLIASGTVDTRIVEGS